MPAALYALARVCWFLRLRSLACRLALRAWTREVRDRGGPSTRD